MACNARRAPHMRLLHAQRARQRSPAPGRHAPHCTGPPGRTCCMRSAQQGGPVPHCHEGNIIKNLMAEPATDRKGLPVCLLAGAHVLHAQRAQQGGPVPGARCTQHARAAVRGGRQRAQRACARRPRWWRAAASRLRASTPPRQAATAPLPLMAMSAARGAAMGASWLRS